jgi:hypothetical protein
MGEIFLGGELTAEDVMDHTRGVHDFFFVLL